MASLLPVGSRDEKPIGAAGRRLFCGKLGRGAESTFWGHPPHFLDGKGGMLTWRGGTRAWAPPPCFLEGGLAGEGLGRIGGGGVGVQGGRAARGQGRAQEVETPWDKVIVGHPRAGRNGRLGGGPGLLFGDDPDDHETCFAVMPVNSRYPLDCQGGCPEFLRPGGTPIGGEATWTGGCRAGLNEGAKGAAFCRSATTLGRSLVPIGVD